MKKTVLSTIAFLVLLPIVLFAQESVAQNPAALESEPKVSAIKSGYCTACPAEKLGRGCSNIALSVLEVPLRVGKEMEKTDPVAGIVSGVFKGVFWTAARLTVGVLEVATFLIPTRPLIREFDAGWWTA